MASNLNVNEQDERTVYVRNLDDRVTQDLLKELFIQVIFYKKFLN